MDMTARHAHHHPHPQHAHQPQVPPPQSPPNSNVFNEYVAYTAAPGQPETYSVLPVGHGNFLKVYHCPENTVNDVFAQQTAAAAANFSHINMTPLNHQHPQHKHPNSHHQANAAAAQQQQQVQVQLQTQATPAQQQTPPMPTQLYELFATNPLLPKPDVHIATQLQPSAQQQQQSQPQCQYLDEAAVNVATDAQVSTATVAAPSNNANVFINNLVSNWSPNLTGGSYIQFTGDGSETVQVYTDDSSLTAATSPQMPATVPTAAAQPISPVKLQAEYATPKIEQAANCNETIEATTKRTVAPTPTATSTATVTAMKKAPIVVPGQPEGKKRIVAEVKPMPLSYSDVLSKGSLLRPPNATLSNGNLGEARAANTENGHGTHGQRRHGKDDVNGNGAANNSREMRANVKRSPLHEPKDMPSNNAGQRSKKRSTMTQKPQQLTQPMQQQQAAQQQTAQQQQQQQQQPQVTLKSTKPMQEKKRSAQLKLNNSNGNANGSSNSSSNNLSGYAKTIDNKTNNNAAGNNSSSSGNSSSSSSQNYANRKAGNNRNSSNSNNYYSNANNTAGNHHNNGSSSNVNSTGSSSKRYATATNTNLNSNAGSYSYSSKRNRSVGYASSNSPSHASLASNRNYELAKRILHTWWIYTLKLLTWLFYLVYDIVVLGCSMAYERLTAAYVAGVAYARQLHKELRQNSGKPSIWWRNYWRRFDARFKKNSKWAFWRRFYKRKQPEASSESFKTGRLPQTGEEAMYSLLNCKGKDAYSILGVPPDSSQEQIRKHYKKIAVLVHPDKNKQAGAEEAFKVLQRAFELIGEPENRLAYDQSIAETLHAEKAWTELHDLLSQLQTKMTEAANTIRCSTCAQRHPRKLTERPHYAARECASCKIRHSAKDGDIWAETSFLGLRWKYLALMDGKVYDITEWANCQKGALAHLEPNSHMVQYRIVRGAQQQQQTQEQQRQYQQQHTPHTHPELSQQHGHHAGVPGSGVSEATLHEFLDNLYSGQHPSASNATPFAGNTRRRTRRN
ncbi:CG14650 [Drosophila busckii]|uniref:CG14650 n=1 Tax=Drosophila busckii TaxID=30019 RepID=A0A0M3QX39_DROBS|nr:CG14650 [Drosophila busckii]